MLKIRIIPSLLFNGTNLVKGKNFNSWRTVGSVFQSIKLFSLRSVDELIFLDISAYKNKIINFKLIDDFADECFMPLTVGGGIRTIDDIKEILRNGADKVSINSAAIYDYKFIKESIKYFGSQCIIVSIDYKKNSKGEKKLFINSEKKAIECFGLTNTWKDGMTYQKIKNSFKQMVLFDDDFNECDSGNCGI